MAARTIGCCPRRVDVSDVVDCGRGSALTHCASMPSIAFILFLAGIMMERSTQNVMKAGSDP